ncbi:MAG: N-acetylneuraminate synthase family protein [Bacteroidia bacterium]|nr:N-acetylneuraminate synthase family protein [Bacteroidia bacterium]
MMKVIAEVANVHEGEFSYMLDLVKSLVKTKVNAIKFQYVIPAEFGDKDSSNYIELDRLKLSHEEFETLLEACPNDLAIYYDVFAEGSYQQVKKLKASHPEHNIAGVKLHVTNSMDFELLERVSTDFETVFISISGLTAIEINKVIQFAKSKNIFEKIVLVYGVQNYPTKPESIKINKLSELKKIFGVSVSLSDHLDGDNPIAADMVSYAFLLGYDYIEKHVTLDRSRRLDDDHAALNIDELELAIDKLHMLQSTFTNNVLALSADEVDYRNKSKQAVFAVNDIQAHEVIQHTDLGMKREESGGTLMNLLNVNEVRQAVAANFIPAGKKLSFTDIEHTVLGYIFVRSGSSRYPEKCYQETIDGMETLRLLIRRLKQSKTVHNWVLCTTNSPADDRIQSIGESEQLKIVRGSEMIYKRLQETFDTHGKPEIFLRITADNVFIDPAHIDEVMPEFLAGNYDYYRHADVIDGCDFEILKSSAYDTLNVYFDNYLDDSEYLTLFLMNSYFYTMPAKKYNCIENFVDYRFTLDYKEDLDNIRAVLNGMGVWDFNYESLCNFLKNSNVYKSFEPMNKALTVTTQKRTLF